MIQDITKLYHNCSSTKIILHTIDTPELARSSNIFQRLRKDTHELEITDALLPWITFFKRLLFAWSYSPLPLNLTSIKEVGDEYLRLTDLWAIRRENFQAGIVSAIDELNLLINEAGEAKASLSAGFQKIADKNFDTVYVCQKHWGWGIDNARLAQLTSIKGIKHVDASIEAKPRACFFGSPWIYSLKGYSGIWTAPQYEEIHFLIPTHTSTEIPNWKSDSIRPHSGTQNNPPWSIENHTNVLMPALGIASKNEEENAFEHHLSDSLLEDLIDNLNSKNELGSPTEDEIHCVLLSTESGKVIPIRQHSRPDTLALGKCHTIEPKDPEEIVSGDIILLRTASGVTVKEIDTTENTAWELALELHNKWKEALTQLIDIGLMSEIKEAVGQTAQSIRNWSKQEHHGPENRETFTALMQHLGMGEHAEAGWSTIRNLRGLGHKIGTEATEALKNDFLKLKDNELRLLHKKGRLTKYLNEDFESASMDAVIIDQVISYSAKIRVSLVNQILTPDTVPWQ